MMRTGEGGARASGVALAMCTAIISGVAVFINGYGVQAGAFGSPTAYTTAKNLVAAVLLGAFAVGASAGSSTPAVARPRTKMQWGGVLLMGVIGGGVAFILFFEGLARASSAHAAFIHKTLVVWVALLAIPVLKERVTRAHLAAIALLVAGQATLDGGIAGIAFGSGEAMIAAATILWSVEVIIAKRLLASIPALTLGAARMSVGVVVLGVWTVVSGSWHGLTGAGARDWGWALVTGALLTTYVVTWFAALARAHAVDVTAVLVFGAIVTSVLKAGVDGVVLRPLALALIGAGVAVAVGTALRRSARVEVPG